ncbi:Endoribonuclease YSH1 [Cladobotryum mycophilum]|uniref:Endoribonuclease YSH1 n=1 Tax=Cladobotryum mycophilum TaxID=491253 RepID=A0ABR0T0X8_9HYPO
MAPEDLREYAGLNTTTITCKQRLTLSAAGVDLVRWALEGTFGAVEELPEMRRAKAVDGGSMEIDTMEEADEEVARLVAAYLVMGCVAVRYRSSGEVELEWEGNMLNDGIADSVMAVLFSVESSPAAVKRSSSNSKHSHSHAADPESKNPHSQSSPEDRLERLMWFLEAQFGADNVAPVEMPKLPPLIKGEDETDGSEAMAIDEGNQEDTEQLEERQQKEIARLHKIGIPVPGVSIKVDKMLATVWLEDLEVECTNKVFADRVRAVVERAVEVTAPLWG